MTQRAPQGPDTGSELTRDAALNGVLLKVGQLNYTWTNTESLLIHLIAGLAHTDKDTAVVIFLTLNTTRARVDLVERLAKLDRTTKAQRSAILELTRRLVRESALRNRYNHCIYSFDPTNGKIQTIMMRIQDRKHDIRMGKTQAVDAAETANIEEAIGRLQTLNHDIWAFVSEYNFPA